MGATKVKVAKITAPTTLTLGFAQPGIEQLRNVDIMLSAKWYYKAVMK